MHNTGIYTNVFPGGGFQKFNERGLEESTVGVWLRDAGYYTALVGKYLNGYPAGQDENYIPPGWDEWHVPTAGLPYSQFEYTLNESGRLVDYGSDEDDYLTDVLGRKAGEVIDHAASQSRPFFMYLAPYAPHEPARPAPRHAGLFADTIAPRTPAYNEEDMSDKPAWLQSLPLLEPRRIRNLDGLYRNKARSMVAVDEMIGALVDHLDRTGQLERTYIFFTSDNGFHIGAHRMASGKYTPYEEDIHLPLIVSGPGVVRGATDALAMNIDLAPTFAELAGVTPPEFVDGRSLAPLLSGEAPPAWRTAVLYEQGSREIVNEQLNRGHLGGEPAPSVTVVTPDLRAIRTERLMYVEYSTGERELYDLARDPHQLDNAASSASNSLLDHLSGLVARLSACGEDACRAAEDEPLPPEALE
jgi:arylsulfatase A-like enzyme